jgi:hypothetical protein
MKRPTGVTILAILALIGGILSLLGGFGLVALGASSTLATSSVISGTSATLFGLVAIVTGVLALAFAIGAFRGAGWAWVLGIVAEVLNLVSYVVQIGIGATKGQVGNEITSNIVGIVISAIILWYLNRQNVKAYFGRA